MAKYNKNKGAKLPKWEDYEAALEGYRQRTRQLREQRAKFEELNGLLSAFLYQLLGERGEAVFEKSKLSEAIRKYHSEVIPEGDSYRVRLYDRASFDAKKVKEDILEDEQEGKEPCHKCEKCKLEAVNEA